MPLTTVESSPATETEVPMEHLAALGRLVHRLNRGLTGLRGAGQTAPRVRPAARR